MYCLPAWTVSNIKSGKQFYKRYSLLLHSPCLVQRSIKTSLQIVFRKMCLRYPKMRLCIPRRTWSEELNKHLQWTCGLVQAIYCAKHWLWCHFSQRVRPKWPTIGQVIVGKKWKMFCPIAGSTFLRVSLFSLYHYSTYERNSIQCFISYHIYALIIDLVICLNERSTVVWREACFA